MLRIGVIAALAASVAAMPSQLLANRDTKDCSGDVSSIDGVNAIFNDVGPNSYLDILLHGNFPNGEKGWVDEMWALQFPNQGASPLQGCSDIGGNCAPDTLCQDYSNSMGYWVLHAVDLLHSKLNSVHTQLQWKGWLAGLSIDQISDDFTPPKPDNSWAKWVSVAFSMAGAINSGLELSSPVGGMLGMAGAAFTAIGSAEDQTPTVDTTSVENALASVIGSAGDQVSAILSAATGNGNTSILPISTWTTYQTPTARFFSDPHILLDENADNSSFIAAYDLFGTNIEQKLVDLAMTTATYALVGDRKAQEDCNFEGGQYLEYMPGKSLCFYLTRAHDSSQCSNNDVTTCNGEDWDTPLKADSIQDYKPSASMAHQFPPSLYDKLGSTYKFDRVTYYTSLIDCTINGDGKTLDTSVTTGPQIPRCFFNLPVVYGEWQNLDGMGNSIEMSNLKDSNQSM